MMKRPLKAIKRNGEVPMKRTSKAIQFVIQPPAYTKVIVPKGFRRLKWNELVISGDFVMDDLRGFAPWEGPSGFRADSFVKPIYRQDEIPSTATNRENRKPQICKTTSIN